MIYIRIDGITGEILNSNPRKGWSVCRTGTGAFTIIYKKPSLLQRILG